jgi:hypothetical protein
MYLYCSFKNLERKTIEAKRRAIHGGQEGVLENFIAPTSTIREGT